MNINKITPIPIQLKILLAPILSFLYDTLVKIVIKNSNMENSRVCRRIPFVDPRLLQKVMKAVDAKDHRPIKTWARRCTVVPLFVGMTFLVHNGKKHIPVQVKEDYVGHKLGEFAPTRIFHGHGSNRKK